MRLARRAGLPLRAFWSPSSSFRAAVNSPGVRTCAGSTRAQSAPSSRFTRCSSASRATSSDVSRSRSPISCCTLRVRFSRAACSCSLRWRDCETSCVSRLSRPVKSSRGVALRGRFDPIDRPRGEGCAQIGGPSDRAVCASLLHLATIDQGSRRPPSAPLASGRPDPESNPFRTIVSGLLAGSVKEHGRSPSTGNTPVRPVPVGLLRQIVGRCGEEVSGARRASRRKSRIQAPADPRLGRRPPRRLPDRELVVRRGFP